MTDHEKYEPTDIERVETDIDYRIWDIYMGETGGHEGVLKMLEAAATDEYKLAIIAAYSRLAYGRGYVDAHEGPDIDSILDVYGRKPPGPEPGSAE